MRTWPIAATLFMVLLPSGMLRAQVAANDQPAIDVERFWLEPGPGGFLAAADASVLEPGAMHTSVAASLMKKPIVLQELVGGEEVSVPVRIRLGYELAVARGISRRLQLGVAVPVVAAQDGDRLQGIGLSETSLAPVALGDARVHGKLRLQENASARLGYGLAFHLRLPTGNEDHFAGEAGPVVGWSLLANYQGSSFRIAANLGLRLRMTEVILISPARAHANEILLNFAGEYRLPSFPLGGLLEFTKVMGDGDGPSPAEARLGLVAYILPRATMKIAAAQGSTPGEVGSPAWRALVIFEYLGR